jgi:hypothetical protein
MKDEKKEINSFHFRMLRKKDWNTDNFSKLQ